MFACAKSNGRYALILVDECSGVAVECLFGERAWMGELVRAHANELKRSENHTLEIFMIVALGIVHNGTYSMIGGSNSIRKKRQIENHWTAHIFALQMKYCSIMRAYTLHSVQTQKNGFNSGFHCFMIFWRFLIAYRFPPDFAIACRSNTDGKVLCCLEANGTCFLARVCIASSVVCLLLLFFCFGCNNSSVPIRLVRSYISRAHRFHLYLSFVCAIT